MGCLAPLPTTPALREGTAALVFFLNNDNELRKESVSQAEQIKQIIQSFNESIDQFEMATLHLGDMNSSTKNYFAQACKHISSIRAQNYQLNSTLASIASLESTYVERMKTPILQFLANATAYTGEDKQPLAQLNTISDLFLELNENRRAKLTSMNNQLGQYMALMIKITALKHALEEKDLI
ncbi:hypothetical protein F66182_7914 [Fusarium sp. NRRL 66182]|nr:hypothetical protein F66182_7914 [Fusarium sp. NRRL 66182]